MFCPKCGTQNPETGKFCRACGTDLGNVSAAMTGNIPANITDAGVAEIHYKARRRQDPNEVYGDAIKSILGGIGFFCISMALLFTGVAGGHAWWWAMLFPAFTMTARGVSDYLKHKRMVGSAAPAADHNLMGTPQPQNYVLPPNQTQYVQPESRYKTGDLVPPSVTDRTTRHLEINSEGETMTLPKK
jgi:hypothetical protein